MHEVQDWLDQPVFIVSIGKTGTTLLVALLDGHEEAVVIPEETDYFDAVHTPAAILLRSPFHSRKRKAMKLIDQSLHRTHLRLLNGMQREKSFATGNLDYSNFDFSNFKRHALDYLLAGELSERRLIAAIPYAYDQIKKHANPKCWIEKTPYHVFNVDNKIPVLQQQFPRARFIHLYREPLDIFIAYEKKHPDRWSIEKFAYDFKRNVAITRQYKDQPNHLILKYEDLVLDTDRCLAGLVQFMGITYADSLLVPTKNGVAWEGNSVENTAFKGISSSSLDKYKKYADTKKLSVLEQLIAPEKDALGYQLCYAENKQQVPVDWKTYVKNRERQDRKAYRKYFLGNAYSQLLK